VSGGSSGRRGLFVQAADEYAEFVASVTRRHLAATIAAAGGLPPEGLVIGMVGAGSPVHSSGLGCVTATRPPVSLISAPASLPIAEIVQRLNAAQPPNLLAYAAKLAELAREQREGRLKLNLRSVASFAEAISMAERIAVTEAFGVPVIDLFASTEGPAAARPCGAGIPGPADRTGRRHRRGDRRRLRLRCADDRGRAEPAPGGPGPPAGVFPPGRGPGPRPHDQQVQAVRPPVRTLILSWPRRPPRPGPAAATR